MTRGASASTLPRVLESLQQVSEKELPTAAGDLFRSLLRHGLERVAAPDGARG